MFEKYNKEEEAEKIQDVLSKIKKLYIIRYSTGSYDDFVVVNLFVTHDKSLAKNYVKRFNTIVENYREFYKKFEEHKYPDLLHDPEFIDDKFYYELTDENVQYYDRWYELKEFNECFFEEIKIR